MIEHYFRVLVFLSNSFGATTDNMLFANSPKKHMDRRKTARPLYAIITHNWREKMNKKSLVFLGIVIFIFLGVGLIGMMVQSSIEEAFYSRMPKEVEQIGIKSIDLYVEKDFDELVGIFVDELDEKKFYPSFVEITKFLNGLGEYKNHKYIGYYINNINGKETQKVTMQLDYGNKYLIYQYIVANVGGNYKLLRTDFNMTQVSLKEQNRFSFHDKGIVYYIVFLLSIIIFFFSVVTASIVFGSDKKRRILWSLFALCGVGSFSFVWATGAWSFTPISVGFPAAGFSRSGSYAPFLISMRIPIGAVLYWLIKHREVESKDTPETDIALDDES